MSEPIYGLLGQKLGHSWSVPIHRALGCRNYRLIELEPQELGNFLMANNIGGLNVTIPYKQAVMQYCDVIDDEAQAVGSVNTIVRRADGKLYAWNTDLAGFRYMVRRAGKALAGRTVLVLGSGGASRTVQSVVRGEKGRPVVISRSGENNYENISLYADAEIIINTTPVGMYPHNGSSPVDLKKFPSCRAVLDLIYNPQRTALLLQAEKLGIPYGDGLPMLVAQAAAAQEHFFRRTVPEEEIERLIAELRKKNTNIILIGMPGCGKTTVGRALAGLSGREAIDIDECIIRRTGKSIPEIFASHGEEAFRALERAETAEAGKQSGKIIITGGGVVKDIRNYDALRQNGRIYLLKRPLSLLPKDGRPLSQVTDLEELYRQRAPLYDRFKDVAVENCGSPEDTAAAIWRDFCEHFDY